MFEPKHLKLWTLGCVRGNYFAGYPSELLN